MAQGERENVKRRNLQINFKVIPAREQRYPTCGDYWCDEDGVWQFRVTRMGNLFYEILVLIHELTEWAMCEVIGIREPEIKKFDEMFEAELITRQVKEELHREADKDAERKRRMLEQKETFRRAN